ncbi:M56 family metallopeptidase [Aneurinibacillus aneurinilyticus]|uniref:M56 family metallopeptidase n=1 Tax=Aneurinibacillus aneurinilyticus TaxID=1391 RepID=UPI0023F146C3|nr:M56 family metallopeptidase [Aneurinibacillus aneurinilyticus]
MSKLLELLVSLSVAGSTAVACILLLRLISPGVFSSKWRYAIGKMAIGLYLLPVALVMQWPLPFFIPKQTTTVPIPELPSSVHEIQPGLPTVAIPELNLSADVALVFLSIWGTGVFAFAMWQVYCYRRFIKKLQQTRSPVLENSEAAKQLTMMKEVLGMQGNVRLAHSSAVRSPILVGLWRPTIYLPMENLANVDMAMVIHHELIHLKRKDLWIKAITLAASALHWFNPLVYILRKDIHTWSELSCDEEVVKEMSYTERKRYGETLLNVMTGSRGMPARFFASLSSEGKQLKRRLTLMLNVKKLKKHTIIMSVAAVIAVGIIGTSTAAWAAKITPKVNTDTNQTIRYDGVQFLKYSALTPDEQKFVTEKGIGGLYALEGYERLIHFAELTPDEQRQVTKEDGYYSPESIARIKESFVTITHQEDPSIPPGTSMTIRSVTPEERAVFKKREEEDKLQ